MQGAYRLEVALLPTVLQKTFKLFRHVVVQEKEDEEEQEEYSINEYV